MCTCTFVRPVFYGRKYSNNESLNNLGISKTNEDYLLKNKYLYVIGYVDSMIAMETKTDNNGFIEMRLRGGRNYLFYVSDNKIKDFKNIPHEYYSKNIEISNNTSQEIVLYEGLLNISIYIYDKVIDVRLYGKGVQKGEWPIKGVQKAIFFIGGLHGNEEGGIKAIEKMEEYLQQELFLNSRNRYELDNTIFFFLNPVNQDPASREIDGVDPNRTFKNITRLKETIAIDWFLNILKSNYDVITIISGHQYNIVDSPRNAWRNDPKYDQSETRPRGVIMPLYIEGVGIDEAWESIDDKVTGNIIRYKSHNESKELALEFIEKSNIKSIFKFEPVWYKKHNSVSDENPRGYIYPQEFMYYINDIQKSGINIKMIEFEVPNRWKKIDYRNQFHNGLSNFIKYLINK